MKPVRPIKVILQGVFAGCIGLAAGFFRHGKTETRMSAQAVPRLETVTVASSTDSLTEFREAIVPNNVPLIIERNLWRAIQSLDSSLKDGKSPEWVEVLGILDETDGIEESTVDAARSAVTERWLAADPDAVLAWLRKERETMEKDASFNSAVIAAIAKMRPQMLMDFIGEESEATRRSELALTAVREWGRDKRPLAESLISTFPEGQRGELQEALNKARAQSDPEFGIALARQSNNYAERRELLTTSGEALAKSGNAGFIDALARNPQWTAADRNNFVGPLIDYNARAAAELVAESGAHLYTNGTIGNIAGGFSRMDLAGASAWAASLPATQRKIAERRIGQTIAEESPREALDYYANHPPESSTSRVSDPRSSILDAWLTTDENAARAWIQATPAGELSDWARAAWTGHLFATGRTEEALNSVTRGASLPKSTARNFARALAEKDPMLAAEWAAGLRPGDGQNSALKAAASALAGKDPKAAGDWISGMPKGLGRDHATMGFVASVGIKDPQIAGEWIAEIEDRWQRSSAAAFLHLTWKAHDAPAADAWVRALPGINEVVRRKILTTE